MKVWILTRGLLRKGDFGDLELLHNGFKFKLPASWLKKFAWSLILTPYWALYWARSGELMIPYNMVLGVELVEEKAGLATPKAPFIRLHFRDERGEHQSITFAVQGWGISGVKKDETLQLYEQIRQLIGSNR